MLHGEKRDKWSNRLWNRWYVETLSSVLHLKKFNEFLLSIIYTLRGGQIKHFSKPWIEITHSNSLNRYKNWTNRHLNRIIKIPPTTIRTNNRMQSNCHRNAVQIVFVIAKRDTFCRNRNRKQIKKMPHRRWRQRRMWHRNWLKKVKCRQNVVNSAIVW